MSLAPKNNLQSPLNWQPSATLETLRFRAQLLSQIRKFFSARNVLEVETPLMCHTSVTDPFIESIPVSLRFSTQQRPLTYYLQTSPEYAMKRLLAAGSGAIYQICKAFRQGEVGRFHNPEFSMLEWYQPNYNHHQLMDEMDELLRCLLKCAPAIRYAYSDLFANFLNINVHDINCEQLKKIAQGCDLEIMGDITDDDTWLQLLMDHIIETQLTSSTPVFIYDFPASQSALAKLNDVEPPTAARFEVYIHGIELANGFYELQNADEQRARFEKNLASRQALGAQPMLMDELFLAALTSGLPDCSGVALGIDRLLMIAAQKQNIAEIISFDINRV